jgi:hypothetical protein
VEVDSTTRHDATALDPETGLDALLGVDDISMRYGVNARAARALMNQIGALPVGRRILVRACDVREWEASRVRKSAPPAATMITTRRVTRSRKPRTESAAPRDRASDGAKRAGWWRDASATV